MKKIKKENDDRRKNRIKKNEQNKDWTFEKYWRKYNNKRRNGKEVEIITKKNEKRKKINDKDKWRNKYKENERKEGK